MVTGYKWQGTMTKFIAFSSIENKTYLWTAQESKLGIGSTFVFHVILNPFSILILFQTRPESLMIRF